jgi:hypothetical protein
MTDYINNRIKNEICYKTIDEISDKNLMIEYLKTNSVKNEIKNLECILEKYIDKELINKIIQEYIIKLIPPGTKGVIRGNKFNNIVKNYLLNLNLDKNKFEICFEKKNEKYITNEIPDWYISEKINNKVIIGMNQLDLWKGGQQINRGYKYIINNKNDNYKLLCVICNEIQLKNKNNKVYKLFETGFKNNTLCYINNLHNIIISYFNLEL